MSGPAKSYFLDSKAKVDRSLDILFSVDDGESRASIAKRHGICVARVSDVLNVVRRKYRADSDRPIVLPHEK